MKTKQLTDNELLQVNGGISTNGVNCPLFGAAIIEHGGAAIPALAEMVCVIRKKDWSRVAILAKQPATQAIKTPHILQLDSLTFHDECSFTGILSYIRDSVEYRAFIDPVLIDLYEIDKETGTEYYKTLYVMLINNCRSSDAAKQLFVHRNTLKYRLDKINQIIKRDIYDNQVSSYLLICYALLARDYPITNTPEILDVSNGLALPPKE